MVTLLWKEKTKFFEPAYSKSSNVKNCESISTKNIILKNLEKAISRQINNNSLRTLRLF